MQPRSGRARPPSSPAWGPESWRGRQSATNTGIPCVYISPSRVQRVEAHRTGMYGPEKPQTATATNNRPTRPSPAPAGLRDEWMDGRIPRPPSPCLPSRPVSYPHAGGNTIATHNTHRSQHRASTKGQHAWPPAQAAPAGQPTFPPLRLHHPSPSRAKLRRQRASLIRSDRQIAGGAGP